jgi:hypothetical protein
MKLPPFYLRQGKAVKAKNVLAGKEKGKEGKRRGK